jgi:FKBP-type peptidyl-prolyl cis-trans isomerase
MLFTNLNESFEKKDSSLNQGSNFNGMQHKIIQEAMPKFPLIEKTSMPNITYMKEPLANMEKKDQKQKQQKSLSQIDKEEFKKLNELEAKFSKKLSEYVSIYKSRSGEVMKPEKCVPVNKPSVEVDWDGKATLTSCQDFTTTVGPYKSSEGQWLTNDCSAGFSGGAEKCNISNYWGKKACNIGVQLKSNSKWSDICSSYDGKNECIHTGEGGDNMCKLDKNNTDTSNAKLKLLNEQLMSLSREMWNQTQKIQGKDLKLQKQIAKKREKLNKNIKKLAAHQKNFNKLNESSTTLTGQLEDTSLRSNTEYMHYMAWFIAATTIGAIAFQRLLK